ncbi:hypothetical protein M3923_000113 [Vibrio metschnikovii]|uniref:Uncharacterized protein n=2 Tax=Bacteria TaxID=2 RepID=A0AAU6VGZ7_UNCXX|nr:MULTISPECIES: hypothetical protein [Vibrio]EKO3671510.1 hypothetical protein [Vibrio metschnikovii]EKO3693742.1 hypothetical protein [Vibrio metschnikovii]EKO3708183.1 hypothetical protein [Vibrio metschnikovii]EKO3925514.1 hypothetical protein [Vibrio metschnikovii]MDQ2107904.1 hypothetical protein [Vibrio sp. 2017_1457_15]
MEIPTWQYVISMTCYIVFLLLLVEGMRRTPRLTAVLWLASLCTFPLWADQLDGWFRWVKTISVLLPTALVVGFARVAWYYRDNPNTILKFFRGDWVLKVLYAVLFLNIAEATLKDLVIGNYFNFLCGIILCITIPFPRYKNGVRQYWLISKDKPNDLLFYSTAAWNFLYTTWNLAFVYGENTAFFASSFCILIAAELYPVIKKRPELYVIARVYTLAFHIFIRANIDIFTPIMDSSSWRNESVLYWWGAINLLLHIPFAIWYFRKKKEQKEPPFGNNPPPLTKDCINEYDVANEKTAIEK